MTDVQPVRTQYLSVGDARLAYDDEGGTGPLIVAVPGMGDLRSEYRALSPYLTRAGYRVVTMDVRGFGETSAIWGDYSAKAVGWDIARLIEHLDSGPAVVLGNSFAAGAALWAARERPAEVSAVVLLGPIVRDSPPNWFGKLAIKAGFAGPWRVWFWMTYWNSLFSSRRPEDHGLAREALRANLKESGRMDALRIMVSLSKLETEGMLGPGLARALVVMGTRDPDFKDPTAEAEWLAQTLGSQCLMVQDAGHYPHLERADLVGSAIIAYLNEIGISRFATASP
ncbi:alpha/beta fold hydrolase [Cupriavidus numazuensis]|uniref:2-succinyl-6-hydroxy-2, 4-cyclohexadiene-1-carboxylate synthase n=1 Tax=Cupriavidus numazuensis TaxID=221992 RepID=A0ABM8TUU3_9BURK|nr:alpha/beta hydrolase [Cupriavidus numazuensis]CAG2160384.1 2-succinyl-6-hydroxy-2, 4-cyclohexadiene-1-carboxylate synthase [Cupriavidus numazuensis]